MFLYKVTGDYGQVKIHEIEVVEYPEHYRIVHTRSGLAAHEGAQIVRKGRLGALALSPGEALVAFMAELEKSSRDLVEALGAVRALRSQVFLVASTLGVEIDLGDPGAESDLPNNGPDWLDFLVADAMGIKIDPDDSGAESDLPNNGLDWLDYMAAGDPGPERPINDPYDEGYNAGYSGQERECPYTPAADPKARRWCVGYSHGCEARLLGEADWGDGGSDPEDDLKSAALNRGRP
jgi:hypothetical protein